MDDKSIYLFLHIPRTGGTYIENAIGHWADRTNDRYLKHYHYVQNYSERAYDDALVPLLKNRTNIQQKEMKIMTGHSIFCNSHKWLRVKKEPRVFSVIRDPVERCLSSFNYRHTMATLCQDPGAFATSTPFMTENACHQRKTADDYDTLYEYYQDCVFETNIQCKWIVKSFLKRNNGSWYRHPTYLFGPDSGVPVDQAVPLTWPEWMFYPPTEEDQIDWYELASNFFNEIWWLTRTEKLSTSIKEFAEYAGLEFCDSEINTNTSILKKWTLDEVKQQHDYHLLVEAEQYDYKLYEAAKNWIRPF